METIMDVPSQVELHNQQGKITVEAGRENQANELSFVKVEWKEWCVLHDREENGKRIIEVENTSFTGEGGCHLDWNLKLSLNTELSLQVAGGEINGEGQLASLSINLAGGKITWKKSAMPLQINLAGGTIDWEASSWPVNQSSAIKVAGGKLSIKSPKEAKVTTAITSAFGVSENDFQSEGESYHQLSIHMAGGKATHKSY